MKHLTTGNALLLSTAMIKLEIMYGKKYGEAFKRIPLFNNTAM
jgi:hypothetical protein